MEDLKLIKSEEERMLLRYLGESLDLKKAESTLGKLIGSFNIYLIDRKSVAREERLGDKLCNNVKGSTEIRLACIGIAKNAFAKSEKSGKAEVFSCPAAAGFGFSYALKRENATFGYIIGCRIKQKPLQAHLDLFGYFIEVILKTLTKERQLDELYKTVKPRAIALSTVHTLHRLISSSLYLDELLSRVARLSMQIIKAKRCSIKLVDSRKKTLLPKATVDLRTKKAKLKKVKIGRWAPGKAVKYGKSVWSGGYLATPLIDEDIIGVITLYDKTEGESFNNFDVEIMRTLAEQAAVAIRNAQLYKEQEKLTMGSIRALAQILESRGAGICTPNMSFLRIAQMIGHEFRLSEHELKILQYASLLHDAGELMVPERLLRKKGKLTKKEFRLIKEHPLKGAKIIKSLKSLKPVAPIIMYHHENYDGSGYPKGLKGCDIPLGARIMGVVSAFEAMITKRPYRGSFPIKKAVSEIKKNSGKQFDPKVVEAFLKVISRKDIASLVRRESKKI